MAKITRKNHKIFGSSLAADKNISEFGSQAAGSPAYSLDPDDIQSAEYSDGWAAAVVNDSAPFIQDMNSLFFLMTRQIAYKLQAGIPEYSSGSTYYTGNVVNDGTVGIYYSLTDNNTGNALTDATKWAALSVKTSGNSAAGTINCQNCLNFLSTPAQSFEDGSRTLTITNLRDGQRVNIVCASTGAASTIDVTLDGGLTLVKGGAGYNVMESNAINISSLSLTRIGSKVIYVLTNGFNLS